MTVTMQYCNTDQLVAFVLDLHGGHPVIPHFTDKETETEGTGHTDMESELGYPKMECVSPAPCSTDT